MNTQTKQWLKYLDLVQTYWENLKRWVLGSRYNPPKTIYGRWLPEEAFIQLYGELSKGGIKDFTEIETFDEDGHRYSYLYGYYDKVTL